MRPRTNTRAKQHRDSMEHPAPRSLQVLDRSPEILACARQQNPGARFLLVDEKNISEVLLRGDPDR